MAFSDYHICDQCGERKTFYDSNLVGFHDRLTGEWLYGVEGIYGYRAYCLCEHCSKTHEIVIRPRDSDASLAENAEGG